ncbi:hypothetical protein ACIBI8_14900 [Streptomyces sp. NPDC050529]|uniref:hypothetical protein n=1 Tax=Streptomyces sp. NPDC050529 TaxID=3365624 RepID=UPI00378D66A6
MEKVVDLGVSEGGAGELGNVLRDLGAAVGLPFVGEDRGDESEVGLGGRGVEVRDMGVVPVEVLLVHEESAVHDQQGVGLGPGEQLREGEGLTVWSCEREVVEGSGRRGG